MSPLPLLLNVLNTHNAPRQRWSHPHPPSLAGLFGPSSFQLRHHVDVLDMHCLGEIDLLLAAQSRSRGKVWSPVKALKWWIFGQ